MPEGVFETIHATCVAIASRGVVIEGPSGSGKSDLALRLIDRGAILVSDDYTRVRANGEVAFASSPAAIAGKLEVRGVGIVTMDHLDDVALALVVRLTDDVLRMPGRSYRRIAGIDIPYLDLFAREVTAALKVELALSAKVIE